MFRMKIAAARETLRTRVEEISSPGTPACRQRLACRAASLKIAANIWRVSFPV